MGVFSVLQKIRKKNRAYRELGRRGGRGPGGCALTGFPQAAAPTGGVIAHAEDGDDLAPTGGVIAHAEDGDDLAPIVGVIAHAEDGDDDNRTGPGFLEGVRIFDFDVDKVDGLQTLYNNIEAYFKSEADGVWEIALDGDDVREIAMTLELDGEFDHFFIKVKSKTLESQLVLWISLETLYSVGCRAMRDGEWVGLWREFGDGTSSVIPDSVPLNFGNSYEQMYKAAHPNLTPTKAETDLTELAREFHIQLLIGRQPLRQAIRVLTKENPTTIESAESMMGLCTMVCESLRFKKFLQMMNGAFQRNEEIRVGLQNYPLLVMWGSSCKVFFYSSLHPHSTHEQLLMIKTAMNQEKQRLNETIREREVLYTLMEEVGIFKQRDTSQFTNDARVTKFLKDFKRNYGFLRKARM